MEKNKKKIIVISSVIAVIVVAIIVGVILFFTTDLFKGNQELFFKYLAQNDAMIQKYAESTATQTTNNIKQDKYITEADISFALESSDPEIANQTIPARNFSIQYAAKADPKNERDSAQGTLKFLDKDLFTLKYIHNDDTYAVTSDEVINKYLGIKNSNLKQLVAKYGVTDLNNIPDKIESFNWEELFSLTQEQEEYLTKTYAEVISLAIPKSNYYKMENEIIQVDGKNITTNAYGVSLTQEEFKGLIISVFNKVKEDDTTLNLLLQKMKLIDSQTTMTTAELKTAIETAISQMEQEEQSSYIQKIQVYENGGQLVRTQMIDSSNNIISIDYEKSQTAIRVVISFEYAQDNSSGNLFNNTNTINDPMTNSFFNTIQEPQSTASNRMSAQIKSIEFARQNQNNTENNVIIVTVQAENETIKLSYQNQAKYQETQINETITWNLNISDTTYFTMKMEATTTQDNTVEIEELTSQNSVLINDLTPEYTAQVLQGIVMRVQQLYQQKLLEVAVAQQQENIASSNNTDTTQNNTNTSINEITTNTVNGINTNNVTVSNNIIQ